ncbi:glutathione S-transferase family protein [Sphingomonas sp. BIUV-7]|uniref:Glutathione S-transferase family protein n=1 Tax=Sphingomonas natans TaxID=3063330 RepID=A0ABT8Y7K9_9SPHN|nr:glutathione S-transferase family protein [Sphingomonas sp. BIUV-7]MDO6414308.1 glutathione S-transferase family protein [Sphingomonas sp. BIUV-7]
MVVDDGLVLAESASILRFLEQKYGNGRLVLVAGTPDRALHDEWLDYVESSLALPAMLTILGGGTGRLPTALASFTAPELTKALSYTAHRVRERHFLMGERLTLADIQMSYMLATLRRSGQLADYAAVLAYLERLEATPGLTKAVEIGGPMTPSVEG